MFYFIFFIIVLILFFVGKNDKRDADKSLIAVLVFFMLDIFALILYLSKDVYYYNVLNEFFSFPKAAWDMMMYSNIPKGILIRAMNLFSLLFLYFSMQFSLTYLSRVNLSRYRFWKKGLIVYLVLQYLMYDPWIYKNGYLLVCNTLLSARTINQITKIVEYGTRAGNLALLGVSIIIILVVHRKVNMPDFFKGYALGESICYICMTVAYSFIFWFAPSAQIKVSKLAGYVTYIPVPLTQGNMLVYKLYPCYLIASGIAIFCVIFRYIRIQRQYARKELEIKRQIDAADTTSKAFCHFMKNEILSIQSEVDMLEVDTENEESKQRILEACEFLYLRLDELHHSTKLSKLTLKQMSMREVVNQILAHMELQLQKVTVTIEDHMLDDCVLIDETCFEQAVHNIISNAIDAMSGEEKEDNHLHIQMESVDKWIQLSIMDNGKGIPQQDLTKIFSPFVSSRPIKKHWGIGLTLSYTIITTHGGKIEVDSVENQGTTFKILLPSMTVFAG